MMKIIDFKKKGNVVRFFLGKDDLANWYGDDWDDTPYEHNAGEVYEEYVSGYRDMAFPIDVEVLEPRDDWRNGGNSSYCKDDMKDRAVPCIIVVPHTGMYSDNFSYWLGVDGIKRFYFCDPMEASNEMGICNPAFSSALLDRYRDC